MAAPAQTQKPGPIDNNDVEAWKSRFNAALADHKVVTEVNPAQPQPWYTNLFDCFAPIDLCAITCCLPCVTFGKTYHRAHKGNNMQEYDFVNTSCLMFLGFNCVGLAIIPVFMQRAELRKKYGLEGNFVSDLLTSCCCGCCSLIQNEKEAEYREGLLDQKTNGAGYQKTQEMTY